MKVHWDSEKLIHWEMKVGYYYFWFINTDFGKESSENSGIESKRGEQFLFYKLHFWYFLLISVAIPVFKLSKLVCANFRGSH